jgi:2-polyprenyl-3-methyl-5-hydroxy-6-metoxy-1,4-benzoquinol methylase
MEEVILNSSLLAESVQKWSGRSTLRILVAIASYGDKNDEYLGRVLDEYRSMPYSIRIVVLSNVAKELGPDIEVRVGLPNKNPWSLPFGHKQLFAENVDEYDLFIYAEDDILISQSNVDAFLKLSGSLPENRIPGFFHAETDERGNLYFDPIHSHFHWDATSVETFGEHTFAFYTNEHSACFLLTRDQLRRAISSGGFLVPPHEGRYDMLCAAATDPYTQCGFKKIICISDLERFTVLHLPNNKYAARPYRAIRSLQSQIASLRELERNGLPRTPLFNPETKVLHAKWSKDYYEPVRKDVLSCIPAEARTVLSIGCGWGATERELVERGVRVLGLPIDAMIAPLAQENGIELVYGNFETARRKLDGQQFDSILLINVLHLLPDPAGVLSSFVELLKVGGTIVIATPNFPKLMTKCREHLGHRHFEGLQSYENSGIHLINRRLVSDWLRRCRVVLRRVNDSFPKKARWVRFVGIASVRALFASEFVMVGYKSPVINSEDQQERRET